MRTSALVVASVLLALLPLRVRAAEPDVARWVDDRTVAALWIDVERADVGAVLEQVRGVLAAIEPPLHVREEAEEMREELPDARREADRWRAEFAAAGGREAWILFRVGPSEPIPVGFVPVHEGADAERLRGLVAELDMFAGEPALHEDAIVVGADLAGLPLAAPARGEQIAAALAAAREGGEPPAAALMLIPSEAIRPVVAGFLMQGAAAIGLEPDPRAVVLEWAVLRVTSPPDAATIRLTAMTPDEGAAEGLAALLAAMLRAPGPLADLFRDLPVRAEGAAVVLTLDHRFTTALIERLVPALLNARHAARQIKTGVLVRTAAMGVTTFVAENDGRWPDSLQQLVDAGLLEAQVLEHPRRGRGFEYRKPRIAIAQMADPGSVVVIRETFEAWPIEGAWVAFADGHTDLIPDRRSYDALVAGDPD